MLEALRGRVLSRVGAAFAVDLGARVLGLSLQTPLRGATPELAGQPARDLDQIRAFLTSSGPAALFDLPWLPAYVALCFLFHPLIGAASIVGVGLLVGLTLATDLASRAPVRATSLHAARRQALSEAARRNAEAAAAMGLQDRLCRHWEHVDREYVAAQQRPSSALSASAPSIGAAHDPGLRSHAVAAQGRRVLGRPERTRADRLWHPVYFGFPVAD
jgi:ATP-binding cassette subfamily C protein